MTLQGAPQIAYTLSLGYQNTAAKTKEDEVRQGQNYYQASLFQAGQLYTLSNVTEMFLETVPKGGLTTTGKVCNNVVGLGGVVLCPLAAAVRQAHYSRLVSKFNDFAKEKAPILENKLNEELSDTTTKVFCFIADNIGTVSQGAMVVSAIALPFFAGPLVAAALGIPLLYGLADAKNCIPQKVSLAIEKYMPVISNASFLLFGGPITKVISLMGLAGELPGSGHLTQHKVDELERYLLGLEGPSLKEFESPVIEYRDLAYHQIVNILNAGFYKFKLNYAHCSKSVVPSEWLSRDSDFKSFSKLFEGIHWKDKAGIIKYKIKDDDRFLGFLKEKFCGKDDVYKNFDHYLSLLADEEETTPEEYLCQYLQQQFESFVKILCGELRVKGSQVHLEEAMNHCEYILSYLKTLDLEIDTERIEFEDILLKLAIEAGDYCGRGFKRCTREIFEGIFQQKLKGEYDPQKIYELKLKMALQKQRLQIMESTYMKFMEILVMVSKQGVDADVNLHGESTDEHAVALAQDVHTLDLYRKFFALGFYPLSERERYEISLIDVMMWPTYAPIREDMYKKYRASLYDAFETVGQIHFSDYIRQYIQNSPYLDSDEKDHLLEMFTERNNGEWSDKETLRKFQNLLLVILGIFKYNDIEDDWVSIQDSESDSSDDDFDEWVKV